MRIGLLMAGHLPEEMQAEIGDYDKLYGRLLRNEGIDLVSWPVVDDVFPPDVHAAEGWLISGSRYGAYEDLPWIPKLEQFIRDAYAAGVPIVGICFGHQIVAKALGGKVEKFKGGWAAGRHEYDWNGTRLHLNAWHQDQVVEKPEGTEVVARSPFCEYAALVYPGGAFTVQAHPEFDARAVEMLLDTRAPGVVPAETIAEAKDALDQPTDDAHLAREIGDFFKEKIHE
jgi:GMP synthase-like glutamine amidotransferase